MPDTTPTHRSWSQRIREAGLASLILACVLIFDLTLAVLLYVSFYHSLVPAALVAMVPAPLHVTKEGALAARVPDIHARQHSLRNILSTGIEYSIAASLRIPCSEHNLETIGLIQARLSLLDKAGEAIVYSQRTAVVRHDSWLVSTTWRVYYIWFLVFGFFDESQTLNVHFAEAVVNNMNRPFDHALIEISAFNATPHIYEASVSFHASLSGLSYLVTTWPLFSALFGVSFNFVALCIIQLVVFLKKYGHLLRDDQSDSTNSHRVASSAVDTIPSGSQSAETSATTSRAGDRQQDFAKLD